MTETHWHPEVVDALPMSFVWSLARYWTRNPPLHVLKRMEIGYRVPRLEEEDGSRPTEAELNFVSQLGPARTFDRLPDYVQTWLTQQGKGLAKTDA